jgi:hypothetical protein
VITRRSCRTEDAVAALLGEHVLGGLGVARASVSEKQGYRPMPDCVCINAIDVTGIVSARLPHEPGCSGMTAWRLLDWQAAGVWAPCCIELVLPRSTGELARSQGPWNRASVAAVDTEDEQSITCIEPVEQRPV